MRITLKRKFGKPRKKFKVKPVPLGIWSTDIDNWDRSINYWHPDYNPRIMRHHNESGGYTYGYFDDGRYILHRSNGPAVSTNKKNLQDQEWYWHGRSLEKEDFTSIEMIKKMKAWSLFSPVDLAKLKNNEKVSA